MAVRRIGPYEITGHLGSGGMDEVYRARDPRLQRDVAIKVLPTHLGRDPERLLRFQREARLLAALNHPNIGAIYGIEETDGTQGLVLELIEGDTLKDVIEQRRSRGGTMAIEQVVVIARQIAMALDAAHERGIVHRDLKPANVKVTPDGTVKVLDFGLGKGTAAASDTVMQDSTITSDGTLPGSILGTAAYMSPEQARGAVTDKRTDIWAFGCVLFEMLTGSRPFAGDTWSDTLARVIEREPEWALLSPGTTPPLRRLVRRCLQKDARRRLRDIGDALLDLDEALHSDAEPPGAVSVAARPARDVHLQRLTDSVGIAAAPAVSPDGKMVAFVSAAGGRRHVFVRLLAGGAPLQITRGNVDCEAPRWLPDSTALLYYSPGADAGPGCVWRVSALGGPARRVGPAISGADVSHDGRRLALFREAGEGADLVIMDLDGSNPRPILALEPECFHGEPRWSPDDELVAFRTQNIRFDSQLEIVAAGGGGRRALACVPWVRGHAWIPDGSGLAYRSSAGSTLAYPPTNNLRMVAVAGRHDRQLTFGDVSYFEPDVHASGRLFASRVRSRSDVWRFPIAGTPIENVQQAVRITRQTGQIQTPTVSPDGRQMAYVSDNGGHSNLWLAAIDGSSVEQITFETDPAVTVGVPAWSPSGRQIVFVRAQAEPLSPGLDLAIIDADGSGQRLLQRDGLAPSWDAAGRWVYFTRSTGMAARVDVETGAVKDVPGPIGEHWSVAPTGDARFCTRPSSYVRASVGYTEISRFAGDDVPRETLARVPSVRVPLSPRIHLHPSVSPDRKWLAMPLLDGTTANVGILPTGGGPMRQITDFGERSVFIARWVAWSPDSHFLYAAVADTDADIVVLDGLIDR